MTRYLLQQIGSTKDIAQTCNVGETAVYNWMKRNRIPSDAALKLAHSRMQFNGKPIDLLLLTWYEDTWPVHRAVENFFLTLSNGSRYEKQLLTRFKREYKETQAKKIMG